MRKKLYAIGNWWLLPQRRVAVAVPAKCAGTSFYRSAYLVPPDVEDGAVFAHMLAYRRTRGPFSHLRAKQEANEMYLAVREPVARFKSLWRDKCRNMTPETSAVRLTGIVGLTPSQLLEYVVAHPRENTHWAPQSADLYAGVKPVRYDRLLHLLGLTPVLCNTTEARDSDATMPEQEILEYYSADAALWNQVKDDG